MTVTDRRVEGFLRRALTAAVLFTTVVIAAATAPTASAEVPGQLDVLGNGGVVTGNCMVTDQSANDHLQFWEVYYINPAQRHSSGRGTVLVPDLTDKDVVQITQQYSADPSSYSASESGIDSPQQGGACQPVAAQGGSAVSGDGIALNEPGIYIYQQHDVTENWQIEPSGYNTPPTVCGNNSNDYQPSAPGLSPPNTPPPDNSSWQVTAYCHTVNHVEFYVKGSTGACSSGTVYDGSQFPKVPYINQYDAGTRDGLPIGEGKRGGNACGPSSLLMGLVTQLTAGFGSSPQTLVSKLNSLPSLTHLYDSVMDTPSDELPTNQNDVPAGSNQLNGDNTFNWLRSDGWPKQPYWSNIPSSFEANPSIQETLDAALDKGPVLTSSAFGTTTWGETGGGHEILILGFSPTDDSYIVDDPAGNYFSTPNTGYSPNGHYGPGTCGYLVHYPAPWVISYINGRVLVPIVLPKGAQTFGTQPPLAHALARAAAGTTDTASSSFDSGYTVFDSAPGSATAPDNFYVEDSQGNKTGWIGGAPVNEIPGSVAGSEQDTFTDPAVGDSTIDDGSQDGTEQAPGTSPRMLSVTDPSGLTLHVSDNGTGNYALTAQAWNGGQVVATDQLSGPLAPGADTTVASPAIQTAVNDGTADASAGSGGSGGTGTGGSGGTGSTVAGGSSGTGGTGATVGGGSGGAGGPTFGQGGSGGAGGTGRLTVGRIAATNETVKVPVSCAGGSCSLTLALTVFERLKKGRVVGVVAASPGLKTKTVTLARRSITLGPGKHTIVVLTVNGAGRQLLAKLHTMSARLLVASAGRTVARVRVRLSLPPKPRHRR